jgi:hypothetical protein
VSARQVLAFAVTSTLAVPLAVSASVAVAGPVAGVHCGVVVGIVAEIVAQIVAQFLNDLWNEIHKLLNGQDSKRPLAIRTLGKRMRIDFISKRAN